MPCFGHTVHAGKGHEMSGLSLFNPLLHLFNGVVDLYSVNSHTEDSEARRHWFRFYDFTLNHELRERVRSCSSDESNFVLGCIELRIHVELPVASLRAR